MELKKFIIYTLIIYLLFFFFGQYALASKPGNNSQQQQVKEKQEEPGLKYEVEVRVTKVDVIVTGKKGERVKGLKPENFKIYEDGILQEMTNFYEVKGMEIYASTADKESGKISAPVKPLPQNVPRVGNKIIIYFDNWQLHPMNRNWSVKKIKSFIRNNFTPGSNNQGMVVCLDQKLDIIQRFTSSQEQLIYAVTQVKGRSSQAILRIREKEDLRRHLNTIVGETTHVDKYTGYERAISVAKSFVEAEQNDLLFSLKALNAFMDYVTGIEGRKILIYVSDGLPISPGQEAFDFIDHAYPFGSAGSEAMNYDETRSFKELTTKCNANEITLYPINASGLESMVLSADKQVRWSHSQGSGMVKAGKRTKNDALKLMAGDTGGHAVLSTNDIKSGLKLIENDLQFYYTLGYKSLFRDDNKYHSIQVKLDGVDGKYKVRVRHGFKQVPQVEKIKENVYSRLFLKRQTNPMGIRVQVMPVDPKPLSNMLRLTLKLLLPIKNLALNPVKNHYTGQIKVYVVLKDSEGRISPCHELLEKIKIPAKDFKVAVRSSYPYLVEMYVKPGRYNISLAVRDIPGATTNYIQFDKFISGQ